ncbi:TetR/AcrR family transcriptional regulator [Inquilinus limosus]|uniref:TetR/AcrR family transcriptional regulator n=1 Tax=Inquilinus limosus TaxID=171674 RepID=UPI003F162027
MATTKNSRATAEGGNGRRTLSREDWVRAALKVLEKGGVASIKVDRLAKSLKVTRGSFYFHFGGRKDLLTALLEEWRRRNCAPFEALEGRDDLAGTALFRAFRNVWVDENPFSPALDMAVRDWGRAAKEVARAVQEADQFRMGLLRRAFGQMGYSPDEVEIRARISYFHQIGYYAIPFREPRPERLRYVPIYDDVLTGRPFRESEPC